MFSRANHGLARLVVLASTGQATLEALRWLEGAGVAFVVIDPGTGEVTSASTRVANDNARLRRAQALAPGTETGRSIAHYLTQLKLAGQASIARFDLAAPEVAFSIEDLSERVDESSTLEDVRQIEATAANLYWSTWGSVTPEFIRKDKARVPENWLRFEGRRSALNPGSPRNASDPINALLNYSSRLVEAEGHLATLAVGLDPGLGVLHADLKGRASFVLDLIEAVRPMAERHVLDLVRSQPLRWRDFTEDSRGVVRVLAPLTHRIAEAMPGFATSLAPVVEHVAQMLADASPYDVTNPSILTKEKHKAAARRRVSTTPRKSGAEGQSVVADSKGLSFVKKQRQRPSVERDPFLPFPICRGCGALLQRETNRKRSRASYCQECLAKRRSEIGAGLPSVSAVSREQYQNETGTRPTHSPQAEARRSQANIAQRIEELAWESEHAHENHDPEWFKREVTPGLKSLTLTQIAHATRMSTSSASKIRSGRRVPHPRHWKALVELSRSRRELSSEC
jgi:CRISPR-associated endonuclease Cas1